MVRRSATAAQEAPPTPNGTAAEERISLADAARQSAPAIRARDARARRTMKLLRDALLTLVDGKPIERVTVDDIVATAGIGRSTFYRHFETKEALIDEIATTEIERLVDLTFPLVKASDSRAACMALASYVEDHRNLWSVLLTGGASAIMRETFIKLASIRALKVVDGFEANIPVELGVVSGVGATIEMLAWWLRQAEPVPVEQMAEYLDRLTVRPSLDRS